MNEPYNRQEDGTVINSNLRLGAYNPNSKNQNFTIQKAMILEAYPKDHPKNKYKIGVEYRAVIVGGQREGELLHNVMALDGFGGGGNFHEVTYTPKKEVVRGKNKGDATPPENTDGTHVIVGFLGGHDNNAIILGGWPQPNNSNYGAKTDDGILLRGSFNELFYSIDKNGILKLTRKGTTITIDSEDTGITIETDKEINIKSEKDISVHSDQEITINADQDININASQNVTVNGSQKVDVIAPMVNVSGSGSVNIGGGGQINIGEGAAQAMVLGNSMAALFNLHTHSLSGEGPPIQAMGAGQLSALSKVV